MFEVDLCGNKLEHPLANAAGTCKKLEGELSVKELCRAKPAVITVGSATIPERLGNPGNVFYIGPHEGLNSLGMPNSGESYYIKYLREMVRKAHATGALLKFSGAGFSPDEFVRLAALAQQAEVDIFEANLSCPNVIETLGTPGAPYCFNPALTDQTLRAIRKKTNLLIAAKVPPYSNPSDLQRMARIVHEAGVDIVIACNTFPQGMALDDKFKPVISAGVGRAGVSGPAMKAIALGQVMQWREALPERIAIGGAGGISSGKDVMDYLHVGADYVEIATQLFVEGPGMFSRLLAEMVDLKEHTR